MHNLVVELPEGVPPFELVNQNVYSGRRQLKKEEEDIAICECKYDANDPDTACGERCLNVLTNTECVPGYCPCGSYCKNQRFQKCEYAKTKLFKTEGRGWGLLADENIMAGQFIVEYCGEVISFEEADQRSQSYEAQGIRDAYIISLDSNYFIDATEKGSLARFINHSCQPNCETRKWTVLGKTRVGIFAKQNISVGTELAYDYNFEWYGGANVRCLCGAPNCSIFLGAKSQGFQEHNHVWEDGDDRYTVDEFPLYDSAEDEPSLKVPETANSNILEPSATEKHDKTEAKGSNSIFEYGLESSNRTSEACLSGQLDGKGTFAVEPDLNSEKPEAQRPTPQTKAITSDIQNPLVFKMGPGLNSKKKSSQYVPNRRPKHFGRKHYNGGSYAHIFASKQAQDEVKKCEEIKSDATTKLEAVYDEIRPVIEEHERDNLDSVPPSYAVKWIGANTAKMKAEVNLSFSIFKNIFCPPPVPTTESKSPDAGKNIAPRDSSINPFHV